MPPSLVRSPDYSVLEEHSLSYEVAVHHICRQLQLPPDVAITIWNFLYRTLSRGSQMRLAVQEAGPFYTAYYYVHHMQLRPFHDIVDKAACLLWGHISFWETSRITDMSHMFDNCDRFNLPIGRWDTSNVVYMEYMFRGCHNFNQDISRWNTSKVQYMRNMFQEAHKFNQPIGKWNVSLVYSMNYMFYEATSFNQDLSNWDLTNLRFVDKMFYKASAFQGMVGRDPSILKTKEDYKTMFRNRRGSLPPALLKHNDELVGPVLREMEQIFEQMHAPGLKKRDYAALDKQFKDRASSLLKRKKELL